MTKEFTDVLTTITHIQGRTMKFILGGTKFQSFSAYLISHNFVVSYIYIYVYKILFNSCLHSKRLIKRGDKKKTKFKFYCYDLQHIN